MTNDRTGDVASYLFSGSEKRTDKKLHPYHQPTLVDYGSLSDLVKNNPGTGSDGGAADCSHL